MYIQINNVTYPNVRRVKNVQNKNIIFLGTNFSQPENLPEQIITYRDDGFLLFTDKLQNYKKVIFNNDNIQLLLEDPEEATIALEENYEPIINKLILSSLEV